MTLRLPTVSLSVLVLSCTLLVAMPAHAEETSPQLGNLLPDLHLLEPYWKSEVVHRESVVFLEPAPGSAAIGNLLFEPVRIVVVERADGALRFEEGKDYLVDPNGKGLIRTEGSRLPVITAAELFPPKDSPRSLPRKADNPEKNVLFDNEHWFHDQQVEVTYVRKEDVPVGPKSAFAPDKLPKTLAKLKSRQPVTIGVSGDSISAGYNASGFTKAPPLMPPYPDLVAAELRYLYGGAVKLVNRAVGGWNAQKGIEDLDNLLKEKPDLIIIAYGMNDVGGRNPEGYGANIRTMIERIHAGSADTEIILVATMLGNGDWVHTPLDMFPKYRDELTKLTGPGVALADLTSIWQFMMERKRHLDITGNGVNHPSDFGHRVYASAILGLLAEPVTEQTAMPVPPSDVTKKFKLPDGFTATLFASEPDVVQPIAFTFDERGRMWVVECYSYPDWKGGRKDRVLILEDKDGDGVAESRKIFWGQSTNLTGIAYGMGGIWLCSTPNLLFIPDADRNDVPDGPPVVKLDGWDLEARHNAFNGLTWGPDGWLYGCNGILSNSKLGPPGSAHDKRMAINCGVWRYHPTRNVVEAFAHGTTNPWGLAFDDYGELFLTNCVIKHLFHVIPGAHYTRMFGQDMNPNSYGLIESCADHIHWAGGHWTEARGGQTHDSFGGGHAHSGAAIYTGASFPAEYRNRIFMCNIHGNRLNQDILERSGSGYVAHHAADFFHAGDPWFRGIAVHVGPDGALYVSDWSDTGECHNYVIADRSNGRIVRIAYGAPKRPAEDLAKKSNAELIPLQKSKNDYLARTSRLLLQERSSRGAVTAEEKSALVAIFQNVALPATVRLRSLWGANAVGALNDELLIRKFTDKDEDVRAWSVRLAVDGKVSNLMAQRLSMLAAEESSSRVLLALSSALQRLSLPHRWSLAEPLVEKITDANDPNLPWMLWYGIEALVADNPARAVELASRSSLPIVRQSIVHRMAGLAEKEPAIWSLVFHLTSKSTSDQKKYDYLLGLEQSLEGRRHVPMPAGWDDLYSTLLSGADPKVGSLATRIALIFDDPKALNRLVSLVQDANASDADRAEALEALLQAKPPALAETLGQALDVAALRLIALRGIAAVEDTRTSGWILERFPKLTPQERDVAISTLAARVPSAGELLGGVEKGTIPRSAVTAYHIQQLQTLSDAKLIERVAATWGAVRPTAEDRLATIQKYKSQLTPEEIAKGDASRGRSLFKKNCSSCHKLFDDGGAIGPELTGAQRTSLDYVLQNVIDPSAVVPRDYQMQLIVTADGRTMTGIVKKENEHCVVLQSTSETISVPLDEIESRRGTGLSMMPDGLWSTLSDGDWRDMVRYLSAPGQVPLPADNESASQGQ